MLNLIRLSQVMGALVRGTKSRTTKDQWAGNLVFFIIACAIGTIACVYGGASEDTVLGIIASLQVVVAPYFSRGMSWIHSWVQGKVKVDPSLKVVKVKYSGGQSWFNKDMTLLDAREEGFHLGVLADGIVVNLKFMEKTGDKLQLKPSVNLGISGEVKKGV